MPPKRTSVSVAHWYWWNDTEWVAYSAAQNEDLERGRFVSDSLFTSTIHQLTHNFQIYRVEKKKLMLIVMKATKKKD
jgi:hypothetical protein